MNTDQTANMTDPPPVSIIHADCLDALGTLPDGSIELVYADPPFNTGATRRGRVRDAVGDGDYDAPRYGDSWESAEAHAAFLEPRLRECHRVLRDDGAILLHCDWRSAHHLRLLLDRVFGADCFVNHLIWSYGLGGSSPRRFARKHDDILYYAKGDTHWFEPPMVPAASVRMRGQLKKMTDVLEVPSINNMADERTGYPDQKPLALLRLLIGACCPPGGTVLDPFCGSGTTLVAAIELGRAAIGCDVSADAVAIATARCEAAEAGPAQKRSEPRAGSKAKRTTKS